jgi:hypothetical protein
MKCSTHKDRAVFNMPPVFWSQTPYKRLASAPRALCSCPQQIHHKANESFTIGPNLSSSSSSCVYVQAASALAKLKSASFPRHQEISFLFNYDTFIHDYNLISFVVCLLGIEPRASAFH